MSEIRKTFKDLPADELDFVVAYKYKGKTADEWCEEEQKANGLDKDGNPVWYQYHTLMIDTVTLARTLWIVEKERKDKVLKAWKDSGYLDGLSGPAEPSKLSELMKSPDKQIINEFDKIQFPVVRFPNGVPESPVLSWGSVKPMQELPKGYTQEGNKILRPDGSTVMEYVYGEQPPPEPGSMIHSFGFGFGVANEEGVIIYAYDNLDEFNRLVQKYKREENE